MYENKNLYTSVIHHVSSNPSPQFFNNPAQYTSQNIFKIHRKSFSKNLITRILDFQRRFRMHTDLKQFYSCAFIRPRTPLHQTYISIAALLFESNRALNQNFIQVTAILNNNSHVSLRKCLQDLAQIQQNLLSFRHQKHRLMFN